MDSTVAREIARVAHKGQHYGKFDYFHFHVSNVVDRVQADDRSDDEIVAVAWLHDVLEDTSVWMKELVDSGITDKQHYAMRALTRRPGEAYVNYIIRVARNPMAALVKLHDLESNISMAPPVRLLERYGDARCVLIPAIKRYYLQ